MKMDLVCTCGKLEQHGVERFSNARPVGKGKWEVELECISDLIVFMIGIAPKGCMEPEVIVRCRLSKHGIWNRPTLEIYDAKREGR